MKSCRAFSILFKQHKKKQTFLLMSVLVLLNLLWIKEVPPSCCLREAVAVSWQWFKNSNNNKTEKQNKTTLKTKKKYFRGLFKILKSGPRIFSIVPRSLPYRNEGWEQHKRREMSGSYVCDWQAGAIRVDRVAVRRQCDFHLKLGVTRFLLHFWKLCFRHMINNDTSRGNRKLDKATHYYKLVMDWVV